MMTDTDLYRRHLETLDAYLTDALERAKRKGLDLDGVLFHAGRSRCYHADDREIHFQPTPHFRHWVPLEGPEHAVLARPGQRPRVVRIQPTDYWFETTPPAASYWEEAVDLEVTTRFDQLAEILGPFDRVAYVGSAPDAAQELGIDPARIEPTALMAPLDWHRASKTPYEVAQLTAAVERAATAHLRAKAAFEAGGSERQIYRAYLEGGDLFEHELPFDAIVALDDKSAILHYENKRGAEAAPGKVLLVDSGALCRGYAADLTRTWLLPGIDPIFHALVTGVDALQQELVAMVTPGRPFLELHLEAHRRIALLLAETGVVTTSADQALERGLTRTFFPHGLGHHLGLQVHDVGGHQATADGGTAPPPEAHPFLRNTRTLEPGHVVTIEPGLYFIPMLLEPLRASGDAELVDWQLVDRLTPLGGVRIEDNVLCTDGEAQDLSRPLLPGPAAA